MITKEKPVITVILSDEYSEVLKQFRCVNCGKIAFEYYSPVRIILPGEAELSRKEDGTFERTPTVHECKGMVQVKKNGVMVNTRCKTRYLLT